jgi:hypothetical protein
MVPRDTSEENPERVLASGRLPVVAGSLMPSVDGRLT